MKGPQARVSELPGWGERWPAQTESTPWSRQTRPLRTKLSPSSPMLLDPEAKGVGEKQKEVGGGGRNSPPGPGRQSPRGPGGAMQS